MKKNVDGLRMRQNLTPTSDDRARRTSRPKLYRTMTLLAILGTVFAFILVPAAGKPVSAAPGTNNTAHLSKHDHELLAAARANGKQTVDMLIAAQPGANKTVLAGLSALGATVRYQDNDVSYIRAIVPIDAADKVASLPGVQAANLDEIVPLDDPSPQASDDSTTVAPPDATTPAQNPYMPTQDIGAPQFVAAHPTWDGRGVKVGILDTGVDLLHPALRSALDLSGNPVRKFADWVTYTDPLTDNDPTWINMQGQVTVTGGSFTSGSVTYTGVAADGTYRFGVFHEAGLGAASEYGITCGADVNRNGVCNEDFGVLWNATTNQVWVDSNANRSFADEGAMTDYSVKSDVRTFGTDNPATAIRESVPFVVQTDGKDKFVNIGIVSGLHGTHVAGITAGNRMFNNPNYNGAAPNAQIVSIRVCMFVSGCTAHALIEGMIFAEKQANVDVINMSIGGLPALNDGNNTRAILYNRLIGQYKAQMFLSAGNDGPGINTVGDASVVTNVMSVGASWTHDSYFANYGANTYQPEGLFYFSSRGPREDGGFKPNIVAPGSAVSSVPGWQPGQPVAGTYALPPGYAMENGTSMASPQATGGAAPLIGAAKQSNVQWAPDQLRQAINSSARSLAGVAAHAQGNGLFQVDAAWNLLKTNIKTVGITSTAPTHTVLSGFLATPGQGEGIYDREGWTAGQTGTRTVTFTRTTGGSQPVAYSLKWVGNDGTFSSAGTVSLPANSAVSLQVTVSPATAGVHSAILQLDNPSTTGIDYETLNTVVATQPFTAANNYSVAYAGTADRPDKANFFFQVPANTPAFKVDVSDINGRVLLDAFHPYGVLASEKGFQTGGTLSTTIQNPLAGVWEATVTVSRTSTVAQPTFNVTGSVLGVSVSPSVWTETGTIVPGTYTKDYTFTNLFGPVTAAAYGTSLRSAYSARAAIAAGASPMQQRIVVPTGASVLNVHIGNASDPGADLDLYLYDCHTGSCVLSKTSGGSTAEESVSVASPAAGTWVALVDPYAVPAGSTQFDYIDSYGLSGLGSISTNDAQASHASGASWPATAMATALSGAGTGRFLQGFVEVHADSATGTLLGSGEVNLR